MTGTTYALITGASSGIGKALAEELASRKINVLLVALPNTGLMDVVNRIREHYCVRAEGFEIDLTGDDSAKGVYRWCVSNNYRVNILVNNAGFGNLCSLEESDPSLLVNMMLLNNHALVLLTHLFIPELKRNKPSFILNLGSLASFMPVPNKAVYAATKSFVYSFSSSLYAELSVSGISVSCLCPGGTRTSVRVTNMMQNVRVNERFIQLPHQVAGEAVRSMFNGKFRIIPAWHNKLLFRLRQALPECAVYWILMQVFNRKTSAKIKRQINRSPAYSLALVFR